MLIYFLLLLISFLFYFVCIDFKNKNKRYVLVGLGDKNEQHNMALPVFFGIVLILLMFRAESVGNDTQNYHHLFDKSAFVSLSEVFSTWEESLFLFINYVLYKISSNYRFYLIITAILEIIPVAYYYCKDKTHSLLKIALFVNLSTFVMLFSGIRQAMAISLGVIAFYSLTEHKKVKFWILSIIAFLVHTSAFILVLFYPLYYLRFKKKHLFIIAPFILVMFIFNKPIFTFFTDVFSLFSDKFNADISPTGAITMLIVFVVLAILVYLVGDEREMDDESFALRNILLFAVVLQCFAPLHPLAMRMNYYFIILIPVCVGKTIKFCKKAYFSVAQYGEIALVVLLAIYFCFTVTMEYITGNSVLNTVPYVPFWFE